MNWNRRLFFFVNKWVGKSQLLDMFGRWSAEYAVILLFAWFLGALFFVVDGDYYRLVRILGVAASSWVIAWVLNLVIGLVVREPRPHLSFPKSRLLFNPLMSWKSFPSDHAMSAWLLVFLGLAVGLPGALLGIILAVLVSWGRVFAGVHYPLDIVGGCAVAGVTVSLLHFVARVI